MRGATSHGTVRILLTIVGLNALVMVAWMILQDVTGPAVPLSTGSTEAPARLRANWSGSPGMWLDWLVMVGIFAALLVVAAWRIWGPIRMSAPSRDSLADASIADDEEIGSQPAETGRRHEGHDTRPSHPRIGATFTTVLYPPGG